MLKARTKLTPTSARTREHLILAGERLFAEQGIDNVSLRQINTAAGQRNSSASHYHFGSKESLVTAIYQYRMERLDARRVTMLAAMPPCIPGAPVHAVIGVLVHPMIGEIAESEGGDNFIRFLSQLLNHPMMDLVNMWRSQFGASLGQVYYELRRALPDIPDEVFGARFGLAWELTVNALAARDRLNKGSTSVVARTLPLLYVSNLVDALAGLMSAPVSASTTVEVDLLRSGRQPAA
ncbi:MAG: TetR/AcrR family transcriptional regulator [Gammaproteobacteria bacterium]